MRLLQSTAVAVAPSVPVLGPMEWGGLLTVALLVGGIVYRAGALAAKARTTESDVERLSKQITDNLNTILKRLDRLDEFNEEAQGIWLDWSRWRGDVSNRLATVEQEVNAVRLRLDEERRQGPPDRRHSA